MADSGDWPRLLKLTRLLCVLFIVKTWNFTERDFSKDLTLQINYDKDFKITSLSQYWWLYCKVWKCFCLLRIGLENTKPNNFSKSRKFSREKAAVVFYSYAIDFKFHHCNFTYVSEAYGFMELFHYDLWSFTPDIGHFSAISQFKIYIMTLTAKTFITIVNRKSYIYSSKDSCDIWDHIKLEEPKTVKSEEYVLNPVFCFNYFDDSRWVGKLSVGKWYVVGGSVGRWSVVLIKPII